MPMGDLTAAGTRAPDRRRVLGQLVLVGLTGFVTALALLHWLRPDVSALARVTSEYAVGPYGLLMTGAFFLFSFALAALAIGLARELDTPVRASAGIIALLVAALATAVAGTVPVDVGAPRPVTPTGWAHRIAAIVAFTAMAVAPLLLARPFRQRSGWRGLARLGTAVGTIGLLGFAAIQLVLLERGLAGAAQRVILALVIVWMMAVAARLTRSGTPSL